MAGIYIHIPFCSSKCSYCNFYSIGNKKYLEDYLKALQKEIFLRKEYLQEFTIETLYFGGGTPSLLSGEHIESILEILTRYHMFSNTFEFTLEANPEELSDNYLKRLLSIGVNRLSIGVQSFEDRSLVALGRKHTGADAKYAIMNALDAGFENISLDLIYALWSRERDGWERDLETAFSFPITHLSAYALTLEENTKLAKAVKQSILSEPDEEQMVCDFNNLLIQAKEAGFTQYEISNFGKPGFFSRHNFSYWQQKPYMGLGPSAHSYNGTTSREWNVSNLTQYIKGINDNAPEVEKELLTKEMKFNEYVMLNLRTYLGINLSFVKEYFGEKMVGHLKKMFLTIEKSYYTYQHNSFFLTDSGKLLSDYIIQRLFI